MVKKRASYFPCCIHVSKQGHGHVSKPKVSAGERHVGLALGSETLILGRDPELVDDVVGVVGDEQRPKHAHRDIRRPARADMPYHSVPLKIRLPYAPAKGW